MMMIRQTRWLGWIEIVLAAACLSSGSGFSADQPSDWERMRAIVPQGYLCLRSATAPSIDGKLDDKDWRAAAWTSEFVDIEGERKPRPKWRTRAKMLWDKSYFYIGAEMEEPQVWSTLTQRDCVIFQDNDFEVFIDPDGDRHRYFELELNALNTAWDLYLGKPYIDGGPALNNWNIDGLKSAIHIDGTLNHAADVDRGWSVEIAIPWRALRPQAGSAAPPREGDQWRVNFSRVEWEVRVVDGKYEKIPQRPEHNWVWSPQGIIDMHRPERWGYVQFASSGAGEKLMRRGSDELARDVLMRIYYAQREFFARNSRWALHTDELKISGIELPDDIQELLIGMDAEGYVASVRLRHSSRRPRARWWHVRPDGRVWGTR